MKRPMCVIGLSLTLTTLAAFLFSSGQALLISVAAALTGLLAAVLRRKSLRLPCLALFAAAVGFASYSLYRDRNILPFERAAGETVAARGIVTEAARGNRAVFYTITATFPERPDLPDATLSLRTFGEMDHVAGDVVGCDVRLDEEVAAPGDYTFSRGGFVSGQAVGEVRRLSGGYPVQRLLIALRQRTQRNLYGLLPERSAGLLSAMVLGISDNVDSGDYSAVNRAGTAHLLTVSGLHLSILISFLLTSLERLRLNRRASSFLAIAAALCFAALAGFSASVTRAVLMSSLMLLARAGHRRSDSLSSLGFAVTVICLARPFWVLGRGFWFSACATLGILLLAGRLEAFLSARVGNENWYARALRPLGKAASVGVAAFVFTLPVMLVFNGWFSLVSPLANVLVSPFVTPLIAGGLLCALVGGSSPPIRLLAALTDFCARAVMKISGVTASLPYATVPIDEPWMLACLALLAAAAAVLLLFRAGRRLAGYAALLVALSFGTGSLTQSAWERDTVQLAVIDGCDAAVLLRGGEAVILGVPAKNEVGRLLRYLEFRGVKRIAVIVAADSGEQVDSGLLRLGERYPVGCVVGPNDAYILGQIANAMTGIPVYSGGYASLEVLGGAGITLTLPEGDILLTTRDGLVLKSAADYGIIEDSAPYRIGLYPDGVIELRAAGGAEPSPMGGMLYGEKRFRLRV